MKKSTLAAKIAISTSVLFAAYVIVHTASTRVPKELTTQTIASPNTQAPIESRQIATPPTRTPVKETSPDPVEHVAAAEVMPSGVKLSLHTVEPRVRPGVPFELRLSARDAERPITRYTGLEAIVHYADDTLEKVGFVLTDDKRGTYVASARNADVNQHPGTIKVMVMINEESFREGDKRRVPTLAMEVPLADGGQTGN